MQITTEFPYAVTEIEHCTIELKDGVNLAVRMWLPELSEGETHVLTLILEIDLISLLVNNGPTQGL